MKQDAHDVLVVPAGPTAENFSWAVGIEDTFIPQAARTTGRVLDEYELTQHYRFWREDLALAASLGVRCMRYGIPWYRVNPAPGLFDWSFTDRVLEHLVVDLGIAPIVDLVHYGTPLWLRGGFGDPDYPQRVADYAAAFIERYRDLVTYVTPLNEPWMHAWLCGYSGSWPPYLRGWKGWTRLTLGLVRGMSMTVAALRQLHPATVVVHVEATSSFVAGEARAADAVPVWWDRRFLATDLLHGWAGAEHPLCGWMLKNGASEDHLEWFGNHPQRIDVMGCNFYPGLNTWKLVDRDGRPVRKRYFGGGMELDTVLRRYAERYATPVMVTETSTVGEEWRRRKWMEESLAVVRRARADGVPVVGYTWWPMFSLVAWAYRRGGKGLSAYLAHMGLWDLCEDGNGVLERRATRLVDEYSALVDNPAAAVGPLALGT